ncbi:hsp70-binding protein 1-like isoform X1 [Diaphorina citri]|uniref:Hsp70-binding protein 1-like isoform X1 n=2 Tax=Diaphorina citri TaxID=121845 RepID=A0A1S4EMN7_DIACI|nr:hsp70-binding protein 1-like isoform X1 [Diaphorina citri]
MKCKQNKGEESGEENRETKRKGKVKLLKTFLEDKDHKDLLTNIKITTASIVDSQISEASTSTTGDTYQNPLTTTMSGNSEDNQEDSQAQPNLAIEYAPNQDIPARQPRQPSNLQDLLRYAVEAGSRSRAQEAPNINRAASMNEANRGFLLDALNSMMVNVGAELEKIIKTLKENQDQKDICIGALDNLSDYVCSIDYANDFLKMGGLPVLQPLLEGSDPELRWRAAETVADIVQNNPFSQNFIIQTDFLNLLLTSIEHDSNTTVQVKSLYAVSCLVRDNEECLKEFIKRDGFSVLLRCIQSKKEKLVIKSCFLIACLCTDNNQVKQVLLSMGMVEQMCVLIDIEDALDTEMNEHLLSALASLIKDSTEAQSLCRLEPLNLKFKLNFIKEKHAGNEVYHKELEHVNSVLTEVFEEDSLEEFDHQDR